MVNDLGISFAPSHGNHHFPGTLHCVMQQKTKVHHWLCKRMRMAMAGSVKLFINCQCALKLNSTNQHMMYRWWNHIFCFRFTLIGMNRGVCHQGEPDVYTNLLLPEVSNWIRKVAKSSDEKSICSTYEDSISHPSLELTVSQAYSFFTN